jgi:hypothetical protein
MRVSYDVIMWLLETGGLLPSPHDVLVIVWVTDVAALLVCEMMKIWTDM